MKSTLYRFLGGIAFLSFLGMKISHFGWVRADTGISNFTALKEALEQNGTMTISVSADIALAEEIQVKGCKTVEGKGHTLYRRSDNDRNLFVVQKAALTIKNVCISGKKERQRENTSAFWIGSRGALIMDGGEIKEHYNAAGGPAVRIEPGGSFEIRDGAIQNNKAIASGKSNGRDARGGAIANEGSCILAGGILNGNEAVGIQSGPVWFGGIGGMLYNQGECVIRNAVIKENQATLAGMDIYHEKGAVCREEKVNEDSDPVKQGGAQKDDDEGTKKRKENKISSKQKTENSKKAGEKEKTQKTGKERREAEQTKLDGGARYFFRWEIKGHSKKDWQRELTGGCRGLRGKKLQWKWNGLLKNERGKYVVRATAGGGVIYVISVTVVEESCQDGEQNRFIRFYEPEESKGENQIWRFLSQDIKAVKEEMRQQKNPLSREANQKFFRKFGRFRRGLGNEG